MQAAHRLRLRLLLTIGGASVALASAAGSCGGEVQAPADDGSEDTTASSGSGMSHTPPSCSWGSAVEHCMGDGTSCAPASEVEDGCCNVAETGPAVIDGQCCYWICDGGCCGRPFMIDGVARRAEPEPRADWSRTLTPDALCDEETALALRLSWLSDALDEHASIASFARFTLELLAHAAPPELVDDAQRAASDEVKHARLCFSMANRFGEAPLGPGPIEVDGGGARTTLSDCAVAAVREGCIGETVAALVAREQLTHVVDGAARRILTQIAEDEERHAALAWRFVAWALERGGAEVRREVTRAFEGGLRAALVEVPQSTPDDLEAWHHYGRLSADERAAVTRAAVHEVIAPCVAQLRTTAPQAPRLRPS